MCYCSTGYASPASPISHIWLSVHRPCEPLEWPRNRAKTHDRARPESTHHVLVDANGVQLSAIQSGANRNDVTQRLSLVDAIPPIRDTLGRPLRKPEVLHAHRGYDSSRHRRQLRERGIRSGIARLRTEYGSGLGKFRRVGERTQSWLHGLRRLRVQFDRHADIHEFTKHSRNLAARPSTGASSGELGSVIELTS